MQIETLKVFCDLVELASFSAAAERNGITQSAVSQQIRALERRFEVVLIERGKKNFSVTPEGAEFLRASRDILRIYTGMEDRLKELQNIVAGTLRVATVFSIGLHELPPYIKKFREEYPDVDLQVEYRRSSQVYSEVIEGGVDLGLVAYPQKRKGVVVEVSWKDKLVLICAPGHPLASRKRIKLEDLAGQNFIAFEPDLPTRREIDRALKTCGVQVNQTMEFDNIETVKRAVEIENGVSIVPRDSVQGEIKNRTLAGVEITSNDMWRTVGIVQKRTRAVSPAHREFLAMLKEKLN